MKKRKKSFLCFLLFLSLVMGCLPVSGCAELSQSQTQDVSADLKIHFIDVGQGDATLIESDGHYMLIDAGNNDKGTLVQNYLEYVGVENLDYMIGTHPDADHIGGMDVVLYKFDCKTVMMPDAVNDTRTYDDVIQAMKSKNYAVTVPVVGETYEIGDAAFTIIAPNRDYGNDMNSCSIGILLEHGKNRFLLTGDAEETAEKDILENGMDISADVYKVAHHGSNTATSQEFFDAVHPTYAVISAGAGNSYGHPHAEVLNRLREAGVSVFRTDEQGTIVASSDGTTITFSMSPSDSWQTGEKTKSTKADSNSQVFVHITQTGEKYHAAGCASLKKSDIQITLQEAKERGLQPCAKCSPPKE